MYGNYRPGPLIIPPLPLELPSPSYPTRGEADRSMRGTRRLYWAASAWESRVYKYRLLFRHWKRKIRFGLTYCVGQVKIPVFVVFYEEIQDGHGRKETLPWQQDNHPSTQWLWANILLTIAIELQIKYNLNNYELNCSWERKIMKIADLPLESRWSAGITGKPAIRRSGGPFQRVTI